MSLRCFLIACLLAGSALAADWPAPENLPAQSGLPDPLRMLDGTRIERRDDWFQRRAPELWELFQRYEYGRWPAAVTITSTVLREDAAALGGKATLREVLVEMGLDHPVHLLLVLPNGRARPVACFLGINFAGNYALVTDPLVRMPAGWVAETFPGAPEHRAAEAGRGRQVEMWAVEQSIERGYAVATFHNSDVVPDQPELAEAALRHWHQMPGDARGPDDTATIMAWAWACARMIDYLVTEPRLDATRLAVVGHSRNGKAALAAAAFDGRIALVIPSQAGTGGTAPSRVSAELAKIQANGRPTVETVQRINTAFPYWFARNFRAFNSEPEKLPFDQHALLALCAPRPVLLSCATDDVWCNSPGQFALARAADPIYRLVSGQGLDATELPPEHRLIASRLGWFIRPGKHSMNAEDWKAWLDYADLWLRPGAAGRVK